MSVTIREEADGKVLVIDLSGKLTKADYHQFLPTVERSIKQHGKVRMLIHMHDFHGWTMGALWEDIKVDWKHFTHVERLALVGESAWEHGMAVFCKPFTTAQIRYFDRSEADNADAWIHADHAVPNSPGLPGRDAPAPKNENHGFLSLI